MTKSLKSQSLKLLSQAGWEEKKEKVREKYEKYENDKISKCFQFYQDESINLQIFNYNN